MADQPSDDDKPTTRSYSPPTRRPRDAYGAPDEVTTRRPPGSGPGPSTPASSGPPAVSSVDEPTAYMGRKTAPKADSRADAAARLHLPPVVGWLIVVDGPGKGRSVELCEGRNLVGRSEACQARLEFGDTEMVQDYSIVVRYSPETRRFRIAPNIALETAAKLNDQAFEDTVDLAAGDHISVARTRLRFVPLCGEGFDWADLKPKTG